MLAVTHPIVADLTARVGAYPDQLGSITYSMEPEATAVLACFLAKLRGSRPAVSILFDGGEEIPSVENVPLAELVHPTALWDWQDVFDDADLRAEYVHRLLGFQVPIPRVHPQADGSVAIFLTWVEPDLVIPLIINTRTGMATRRAYLLRNDKGEWRVDRIDTPPELVE